MKIQHYEINTPITIAPEPTGWSQAWHGYHRLNKSWTEQPRKNLVTGYKDERELEVDCFLSILTDIKTQHINLLEIGAGWGEWCMALAGVINHKLVPMIPTSYHCIAIEPVPAHYEWIRQHFTTHNIQGSIILGAVANKTGKRFFNISRNPSGEYGETMTFHSSNLAWGIYKFLTHQVVKTSCFTLDQLLPQSKQSCTIVHMDVQGAEVEILEKSLNSISAKTIDYMLIGTHRRKGKDSNNKLASLLTPYYNLIIDAKPFSIYQYNGLLPVKCIDGIQVYKRKSDTR